MTCWRMNVVSSNQCSELVKVFPTKTQVNQVVRVGRATIRKISNLFHSYILGCYMKTVSLCVSLTINHQNEALWSWLDITFHKSFGFCHISVATVATLAEPFTNPFTVSWQLGLTIGCCCGFIYQPLLHDDNYVNACL